MDERKLENSPTEITKGEAQERLAFTFCKIATFCLLTGRFALPLAATAAAAFFIFSYVNGKRDTRCIGKHPLLIATFWIFVLAGWTYWNWATLI